jgi:hypothetical protein
MYARRTVQRSDCTDLKGPGPGNVQIDDGVPQTIHYRYVNWDRRGAIGAWRRDPQLADPCVTPDDASAVPIGACPANVGVGKLIDTAHA